MTAIFADTGSMKDICDVMANPRVRGVTTNPTLMHKVGVTDYEAFARTAIETMKKERPTGCISLEVFADTTIGMIDQALEIDSWGFSADYDVYVKIPVVFTDGKPTGEVVKYLAGGRGVKVNVTAVFTEEQVESVMQWLDPDVRSIVSVFAGRIADTGEDPVPLMKRYQDIVSRGLGHMSRRNRALLWASPREVLNYYQAEDIGVDVITMTPDLIEKLKLFKKSLTGYSVDTARMFYKDAVESEFKIDLSTPLVRGER